MMPMCLIFSPDKSEKLFERADYFLLVKRPAEALFLPYKKGSARKTCNE
jgi:hypothetical protein